MSAPAAAIATRGLVKRFGDVRAVDSLDLDVRAGEIYGFLGRNGAGKTTTIRMLLGLIRPSGGEVEVLGRRIVPGETTVFGRVGYLVEAATAYPNLTVRENLDIQRRLTRAPANAVADAIALLRLEQYADRRAGQLSLGNKQRLSLARALLHSPDLLVLDEPANALDPAGIVEVRELLRALAADRGVTVFMSSHILAEVAHLADRIGIVHEGRLLEELDREQLHAKARAYIDVSVDEPERAAGLLHAAGISVVELARDADGVGVAGGLPGVAGQDSGDTSSGETAGTATVLRIHGANDRAPEIARLLVGAGLELNALTPTQEDLETYFLRLTGGTQ